eukprot:COSAG01_NODE_3748_length_5737_cov_64.443597_3_plen_89_part_00
MLVPVQHGHVLQWCVLRKHRHLLQRCVLWNHRNLLQPLASQPALRGHDGQVPHRANADADADAADADADANANAATWTSFEAGGQELT